MKLDHRAPSVGSIIKKLLAINPDLSTSELIDIIRQSTYMQGSIAGEFSSAETIDEARARAMAQASLVSSLKESC